MCFPANLIINIKDLLDGEKYEKPFGNLNISAGPDFFESYSNMPCNQFDRAYFEINLYEEIGGLTTDHTVLEINAKYNGAKSNTIVIHT
ncbi:hypothetical protein MNBD_GAMMA09-2698 [hydrothermal vent metagenome]|uniref:Uncharacterized protein n=1 Tax=hydrothermal vent metagenome TaxID=652676 RepID=A0A3B0XQT5_9ZZZZ